MNRFPILASVALFLAACGGVPEVIEADSVEAAEQQLRPPPVSGPICPNGTPRTWADCKAALGHQSAMDFVLTHYNSACGVCKATCQQSLVCYTRDLPTSACTECLTKLDVPTPTRDSERQHCYRDSSCNAFVACLRGCP